MLEFQFSTSPAFASQIIRRLTHSRFSHIDLILPDEGLLGVSGIDKPTKDLGGVRILPFNAWTYLFPPKIARVQCSDYVAKRAIDWGRSEIGKPFDKGALWAFLRDRAGAPPLGRDWRDPTHWICSEFQARLTEYSGLFTYPLIISKDCISPNDLLLLFNPFLTATNIEEFLR